ncbi:hypothetical protein FSP39_012327 [Pinctada imbricata]|uniref:Bromodomain associated domain-containing protein n=1 Tax=Pinctada imbricata TaxID=66713 RepID=A0AA89C3M3_PINIB|nr:hypothetical protein FSP39_012327 [Pinctada imbricata]
MQKHKADKHRKRRIRDREHQHTTQKHAYSSWAPGLTLISGVRFFSYGGACSEITMDTLSDVMHEYFQELCKHLRTAADHALLTGCSGFPDIVEKTFHEMGIGSVTSLNEFYHTRVLNYKINMESTCQNLMSEYEKLIQPSLIKQQDPDNVPVIRIKEEPSSEIQFPFLDENDELNDAEQLLQLEGLGGFEITVEHESASGLTTEVESKWSKEGVKPEVAESSVSSTRVSTLDDFDDPGSTKERPPDTPAQLSEGDSINDPGSVTDIMSPPSISKPSKSKKRYSYM